MHEVKVRRADLLADVRKPAKRSAYLGLASQCWYVLKAGVGSADDTPSGFVNLSLGDGDDAADGLALQANGKIVVAGTSTSQDGSENMIVARLLGN